MKYFLLLLIAVLPSQPLKIEESGLCKLCDCGGKNVNCTGDKITDFVFNYTNWQSDANKNESYPFESVTIRNTGLTKVLPIPKGPVRVLDFSDNQIKTIEQFSFKELTNLTELVLSNNSLYSEDFNPDIFQGHHMAGSYQPLPNLTILRLNGNKFHSLKSNIFEHTEKIEILDLHSNPFKVLDHQTVVAITSLMMLKELDLSDTQLTELPQHFLHTPRSLRRLDLAGNNFKVIPSELQHTHSLEWLSLSRNPIQELTEATGFPLMHELKILHMCGMPVLEKLGENSMAGLVALRELHLSDNPHLRMIDGGALSRRDNGSESETWPNLDKVYLSNNQLSRLDLHFFGRLDTITDISISGNPWTCECENQWLVETLMKQLAERHAAEPSAQRGDTEKAWQNVLCAAPIEMEGKSLFHLYLHNATMRCLDLYGNRPEKDGTLLVGILLGLLVCIPMMLGAIFCYKKNFFNYFESGPAAFSRQFYKRASPEDNDF